MLAIIILLYVLAVATLVLGAVIGYKRGMGRAAVRLVYLIVLAVIAFFVSMAIAGAISAPIMDTIRGYYNDTIKTVVNSNPQLEAMVQSLITAILSPIIFSALFGILQLLSLICLKKLSLKIVGLFKKEVEPKVSKWVGAGIGLVSAFVMVFALFAPVSFVASTLANASEESLAVIDAAISGAGEKESASVSAGRLLKKDTAPGQVAKLQLKELRARLIVFSVLSSGYGIEGSTQSAQQEISNVITVAGNSIATYQEAVAQNPDDKVSAYLSVAATVSDGMKKSEFISVATKEASRAVANLDKEEMTKILEPVTTKSDIVVAIAPCIFENIAETPAEDISQVISDVVVAANDGIASFNASIEDNPDDKLSAYLNVVAAVGANTEYSEFITKVTKDASRAVATLDKEQVVSLLENTTEQAEIIASVLPNLFESVAETPDKELPGVIATFFGEPPVEPTRAKEAREKEEAKNENKPAPGSDKPVDDKPGPKPGDDKPGPKPEETDAPEIEIPETTKPEAPETDAPETDAPETDAPETDAPETEAPETEAPETEAPETEAPETEAPETEAPKTQNNGLIGSIVNGSKNPTDKEDTSIAEKAELLTKNRALFESIREAGLSLAMAKIDVTDEKYQWVFEIIQAELANLINEVKDRPEMSFTDRVKFFASSAVDTLDSYISSDAQDASGMAFLTKGSTVQVIAVFMVDEFTPEKYPDGVVPMEDILEFMGLGDIVHVD